MRFHSVDVPVDAVKRSSGRRTRKLRTVLRNKVEGDDDGNGGVFRRRERRTEEDEDGRRDTEKKKR